MTDKAALAEAIHITQAAVSSGLMVEVRVAQRILDAAKVQLEFMEWCDTHFTGDIRPGFYPVQIGRNVVD